MPKIVTALSLAATLALAACGGKSTPAPAAPAEPAPAEPAATDPELICCTIASADETMSSMVPLEECPEENRTPDACGAE
ncbi:MAG: hypothetical protein JNK64_15825 [Myxococcales bacterium]|nr:hypothetical protein [Myxococcales bacterium]